jgi:hypothetical protein
MEKLAKEIQNRYLSIRDKNSKFRFNRKDSDLIFDSYKRYPKTFNRNHSVLNNGVAPVQQFDSKPNSDRMAIKLWNIIFDRKYKITKMDDVKSQSKLFIEDMNTKFPNGVGATESNLIRFVTASSSSAFLGIQNPSKSKFSYESMLGTLASHCNPTITYKPWLISNLDFIHDHLASNPHIMHRNYADVCMNAKMSSSSIKGEGNYRDFVFQNKEDDIIQLINMGIDYVIYVGSRIDRRGKFRLICSFNAVIRIYDFLFNNGSYALCSHDGILAKYTTEGFNNKVMWDELWKMAQRDGYSMVCIDYKGYDTQISLKEYVLISKLLNKHRLITDDRNTRLFNWFIDWLEQPKSLSSRGVNGDEILIECYTTLASGLHGTHSFENLIGISTYFQALKEGIDIKDFWTNGDDQNALVRDDHVDKFISFLDRYFKISWDKSLASHRLAVWGKLWFTKDIHPMWEIGTFRSIWEKEGGNVDMVQESKFESNYCKILQTIITLHRLGKHESTIKDWMEDICSQCEPKIDPYRLPVTLRNMKSVKTGKYTRNDNPGGLLSSKGDLMAKTFDLQLFGATNFYDMMFDMYKNKTTYDMEVEVLKYHKYGTVMKIDIGVDYSLNDSKHIPYILKKLHQSSNFSPEKTFVQSVLQSTKSFDGPMFEEYKFSDMMTLAKCLNIRNKRAWDMKNK